MTAGEPKQWGGIFPSLVTPFDDVGDLDVDGVCAVADFAVAAGADGILATALAGEAALLSRAERRRCVTAVLDAVDGRVPVLAGAGAVTVAQTVALAGEAEGLGVDGVVLPVMDPAGRTPAELLDALLAVARAVTIPVVIQDAPAYVGGSLGREIIAEVMEQADNVRSVKVEGGSVAVEDALRLGDGVGVWGGDGGRHLLDCLRSGAVGVMPGAEVVDVLVEIAAADRADDDALADERMRGVLPLLVFEMQSLPHYVACAKAILFRRGILASPFARAAGAELTGRARAMLERHLEIARS